MRITITVVGVAAILFIALGSRQTSCAQEFLDTAGRWKNLTLPIDSGGMPRSIVAHRGQVVIARERRSLFVSRDSGETWTNAGGALPADVSTVWAMAHSDTAAPDRILGIAVTGETPAHVRIIETTDGGLTWINGQPLPDLDVLFTEWVDNPITGMRLHGPPTMFFVESANGAGRAGFIYSAAGLMATSDDGRTWTVRKDSIAIRAMTMSDDLNGVAVFGEYQPGSKFASQPGGIYWTSDGGVTWTETYSLPDGGFQQFISLRSFSKNDVRAFIPERFQNYYDWRLLRSIDGGRSWDDYRGLQARRPLFGFVLWRDTADIHVVCDGGALQHASDGGEIFHLLHDSTFAWWMTRLPDGAFVATAPIAAYDDRYLYFTTARNLTARWRMAAVEPLSSAENPIVRSVNMSDSFIIAPNPTRGNAVQILIGDAAVRQITIVDALGRVRAVVDVTGRRMASIPNALEVGRYTAVSRNSRNTWRVPFMVIDE